MDNVTFRRSGNSINSEYSSEELSSLGESRSLYVVDRNTSYNLHHTCEVRAFIQDAEQLLKASLTIPGFIEALNKRTPLWASIDWQTIGEHEAEQKDLYIRMHEVMGRVYRSLYESSQVEETRQDALFNIICIGACFIEGLVVRFKDINLGIRVLNRLIGDLLKQTARDSLELEALGKLFDGVRVVETYLTLALQLGDINRVQYEELMKEPQCVRDYVGISTAFIESEIQKAASWMETGEYEKVITSLSWIPKDYPLLWYSLPSAIRLQVFCLLTRSHFELENYEWVRYYSPITSEEVRSEVVLLDPAERLQMLIMTFQAAYFDLNQGKSDDWAELAEVALLIFNFDSYAEIYPHDRTQVSALIRTQGVWTDELLFLIDPNNRDDSFEWDRQMHLFIRLLRKKNFEQLKEFFQPMDNMGSRYCKLVAILECIFHQVCPEAVDSQSEAKNAPPAQLAPVESTTVDEADMPDKEKERPRQEPRVVAFAKPQRKKMRPAGQEVKVKKKTRPQSEGGQRTDSSKDRKDKEPALSIKVEKHDKFKKKLDGLQKKQHGVWMAINKDVQTFKDEFVANKADPRNKFSGKFRAKLIIADDDFPVYQICVGNQEYRVHYTVYKSKNESTPSLLLLNLYDKDGNKMDPKERELLQQMQKSLRASMSKKEKAKESSE